MVDLYNIFKSITPENIQDIPLVKFCMETFTETLQKDAQVAQNISRIYDDYQNDDTALTKEAKDNLKTGLYMLYVNTLYNACYKMQQDPEILKTLKKFNYTENAITKDLNTLINSEFLGAQRQFSQTVGTEKALHYMYSFAKYLETGYVRDDLEISKRDPFIIHYEGSLNKRTFETVVYPQAHPLGWAYSYTSVITQALRDYYGITLIYYVKKLWLVNYTEGKYVVFTDKTQEEIYNEFRNITNPKTNYYFTDDEIARQVTIYTNRVVKDYQRWEDENGNWCQLFTFDDDMVLYHDGSKHTTFYTSYEDYIDGCKEPQNVWDSNFKISADIKQDVKFEYFDEHKLEKTFNITRVRDDDHKIGDSHYMQDEMSRAFSVSGDEYTFNQGIDESRHILIKNTDLKPVGGYFLPKSETIEDRLRDLEILSERIYEQDVVFNNREYEVVAYDDELYVPEYKKPFLERLRDIETKILPLKFIYATRKDSIELLSFNGSPNTNATEPLQRIQDLEDKINGITEVKVTWDGSTYNLLRKLDLNANEYSIKFENDYEGRLRIFAGGFLEEEKDVKAIDSYDFCTTNYRGNRIRFECTDLNDQIQYVEVNTLNRNCLIYIEKCEICTYGKSVNTDLEVVNNRETKKFGMTVKGKLKIGNSDESFIFDHEVFDQTPFANSVNTVHLIMEDIDGVTLQADVRTNHIGEFEYTFDTTNLQKTFHDFTLTAQYYVSGKVYDSCYYKGNWLNDFDKTPVYITVPEFTSLVSYVKTYDLKNITPDRMVGITNEPIDITGVDKETRAKFIENRITSAEVIKIDGDETDIKTVDLYRNYDFIGEKNKGFYRPDQWSADYLNPNYDGENLYLPYDGYMKGNIIEGEDYYRCSWEFYPEEEVFINMGFRRYSIDTSDFYIMTSTRFVTDDFEITGIGDDFYLYGNDDSYFYTKDGQYLVTDEDDKLTDAWGIKTEDGMDQSEWKVLYEHNGVVLKDFSGFETDLIAERRWLDAYNGTADEKDTIELTLKAIPGETISFKCLGDGQFTEDPHDPVSVITEDREEVISNGQVIIVPQQTFIVDRNYISHIDKVVPSDGLVKVTVESREPFTQGPTVKAFATRPVNITERIDTGVRDENGKVFNEVTHTEDRIFTHTCNIMYNVTDYTPKIDLPRYITKEGYTLRFTNLLPNSPVYITEPQVIIGKADADGVFEAVFKPRVYADYENVIHNIKYYYRGVQTQDYSFILPYVDIRHSLDSEILHAWDPEFHHVSIPGYTYLRIDGCQPNEHIDFEAEGCIIDHPEICNKAGKMDVKIIAKDPYDEPKITFVTANFEIKKEVTLRYADVECEPEVILPTLENIYGSFKDTIDTDTPFTVGVNGLIIGTLLKIEANDVYQQITECNMDDFFDFKPVDFNTKEIKVKVTYRKSGREYASIEKTIGVYQYILSHGSLGTMDAYGADYNHYYRRNVIIEGGKPGYTADISGFSTIKLGIFDKNGSLVVPVESKPDFTAKPSVSVKSQGYELNFEIPYQLTEYNCSVNIGHIYADVLYSPKLTNAPKFNGIENCIDYNTLYSLNFEGFKPNSKVVQGENTYYADTSGKAIITIPRVKDYSTKNVTLAIEYLSDDQNTATLFYNFELYQYNISCDDATIDNNDHIITVKGGKPSESFRVQAVGDVMIVNKDSTFNNEGSANVTIRGKNPYGRSSIIFSTFSEDDPLRCECNISYDLPIIINATEMSDRFKLNISGVAGRKITVYSEALIEADTGFNEKGQATAYVSKETCKVVVIDECANKGTLEITKRTAYREFSITLAGMSGRPATLSLKGYNFTDAPHFVGQPDDYRFSNSSNTRGGPLYDWGEFSKTFTKDALIVTFPRSYTYCWYGPVVIGGNVLVGWTFSQVSKWILN